MADEYCAKKWQAKWSNSKPVNTLNPLNRTLERAKPLCLKTDAMKPQQTA